MNNSYTDITFILDESGSMGPTKLDTIGGFNSLIQQQIDLTKENPNNVALVSVYTFNGMVHRKCTALPLDSVVLTDKTYIPAGSTALLDALGVAIKETGVRFSNMDERDRPGSVLFVVITDGEENASRVFRNFEIAEMIKTQQDVYNWTFQFVGANQDSIANATSLSIPAANSFNYIQTSKGIQDSYVVVGNMVSTSRGLHENKTPSGKVRTP